MFKSDLAEAAELSSYYDTIYHLLSGSIHINPRDLEQYLELNTDCEISEIKWGPDVDDIEVVLFSAVETMIFSIQGLNAA